MKQFNKEAFLKESVNVLTDMTNSLDNLSAIEFKSLNPKTTMMFSIDLNKGFAKSGKLFSQNVANLIPDTVKLAQRCVKEGIKVIAYTDRHTEESPELKAYPQHCMVDTEECQIVDELSATEGLIVINKNSTNGFLSANPLKDLTSYYTKEQLDEMDTFIITGDCTDICIYQYAVTLKAYLNENNRQGRVIVPINLVDTYDAPWHNAHFLNVVFLNSMITNGVEVVKDIY